MNAIAKPSQIVLIDIDQRIRELFQELHQNIICHTDRLFSWLMIFQWFFAVAVALWLSPLAWFGLASQIHPHVWAALFLGAIITLFPVYLARTRPGLALTRHVVAVGQILMSALLIHLTGGRIETHFHIFGSLAILAFYRDSRVLLSATLVVVADHFIRGILWPLSIFGVYYAPIWRPMEHAGWVAFEVVFLIIAIRSSIKEMYLVAERQARLEALNENIEQTVRERTAELTRENLERRESQALYLSLVEQLPAGIFRQDPSGAFVFVNSWFCNLRGKRPVEFIGKSPEELASASNNPNEAEWFRLSEKNHRQIMQTGETLQANEDFPDTDGILRHFQVIRTPVFSAEGKPAGSQGILFDITDRKRAESALAYEQYLLKSLLDNSADKIYFKDRNSKFIRCSESMASNFGVEAAEDLVGKADLDFFSNEHASEALENEQSIIRTGKPIVGKVEKETWPDGRITWAITTKMPLKNKEGAIVGTFGVSKDITAIKNTEAELEKTHRELVDASRQAGMAEVATSVLHNVGNVLNSVNVSASLISEKITKSRVANITKLAELLGDQKHDLGGFFTNDPRGRQMPEYLSKLAEHLTAEQQSLKDESASLLKNIIHIKEVVAMQQGYAKPSGMMEPLNPSDLLEDALRLNIGSVERHHIRLVRDYAKVPSILTDKHKVLQILVNLIRNSKHACDESGHQEKEITLRVCNGDGRVKFSISDNGVGIAPENLTRIFNHGFTTRKDGHGFGLHSGALAARELGGTLTVASEGCGLGATFTLDLPADKKEVEHED